MFYGLVTFSSLKKGKKDYVTYQKMRFKFLFLADSPRDRGTMRIWEKKNSLFPREVGYELHRTCEIRGKIPESRTLEQIYNFHYHAFGVFRPVVFPKLNTENLTLY